MSDADWMADDPAGALRDEHGHEWCIRMYPARGGGCYWTVRRWYPLPESAGQRIANAWEGEATANQVRAWLRRQAEHTAARA